MWIKRKMVEVDWLSTILRKHPYKSMFQGLGWNVEFVTTFSKRLKSKGSQKKS